MKTKRFLAYDSPNHEFESFDTIDEARKWLEEAFFDRDEGYHPDAESCEIFELKETVKCHIVDSKSNYKYENEEDVPEDDTESEVWPYSNQFDEIWKHEFISFNSPKTN